MKDNLFKSFASTRLMKLDQIRGGKNICSVCKTKDTMLKTSVETDFDDGTNKSSEDLTVMGEVYDFITVWS